MIELENRKSLLQNEINKSRQNKARLMEEFSKIQIQSFGENRKVEPSNLQFQIEEGFKEIRKPISLKQSSINNSEEQLKEQDKAKQVKKGLRSILQFAMRIQVANGEGKT